MERISRSGTLWPKVVDVAWISRMKKYKKAKDFYKKLGVKKLKQLIDEQRHEGYLRFLKKELPEHGHILDLACGYGRLTIPLAQMGYHVEGLDIAPNLIRAALQEVKSLGLSIPFHVGSMTKLPYPNKTFDAVICMWSSFNELLPPADQVRALKEMVRVSKTGGLIILDLPIIFFSLEEAENYMKHLDAGGEPNVMTKKIGDIEHTYYTHDESTLKERIQQANIKIFTIAKRIIGGRKRLVVIIHP